MAESVMSHLVESDGLQGRIEIDSAATSAEELGNPVHRGTQKALKRHGIPCIPHHARQIAPADYQTYDLIVGMDEANIRNMKRAFGGDPQDKIRKLLAYAGRDEDVADPWYTGDFETTFDDVVAGCSGLLERLKAEL